MGQAKQRGTRAERIQQAQERTMEQIRARDNRANKMKLYTSAVKEHEFTEQETAFITGTEPSPNSASPLVLGGGGSGTLTSDIVRDTMVELHMNVPEGTPDATFHEPAVPDPEYTGGVSIRAEPQPEVISAKVGNGRRVGTIGHVGFGRGGMLAASIMAMAAGVSFGVTSSRAEVVPRESLDDL